MVAWHTTGATRAAALREIQKEKKYDILLCDIVSIVSLVSLAMDIPFIAMTPLIVSMVSTGASDSMAQGLTEDEYGCYLVDQKVRQTCCPVWGYQQGIWISRRMNEAGITLSSFDLYTTGGKNEVQGNPKLTWYISNREFTVPFDMSKVRSVKQVQANPKVYISFGTEMCNNYPLIDAMFDYFGKGEMDCVFSFGGNKVSYATYKDKKWTNENFRIELLVDQKQILANGVDIYFNHCGAGSIYESIYYAVPMICIPQEFDQPANAKSIRDLGCAIIFDESPGKTIEEKLAERMKTMLGDYEKYRSGMRKQQEIFMNGDTTQKVIDDAFKAFEKNPEAFRCKYEEVLKTCPEPVYKKKMGVVGAYDVCLWFVLMLSVIFAPIKYMM